MKKSKIDLQGATLLLVFMAVLGLNQVGVKLVNEAMAPLFQVALRSLCAAPLIALFMLWNGKKFDVANGIFLPGVLCGVFFAAEFALLFHALELTSVIRVSIFFYTMPFWVTVGAHFLIPGERLTLLKTMGLLLALGGVALALNDQSQMETKHALGGDLMSLVAGSMWAAIALTARVTRLSNTSPENQLFYQLVVSGLILLPLALMTGDTFRTPSLFLFTIFAVQVVFVVAIGFTVWFWVLSIYPASDMASYSFLAPVFGVIFGALLLDEAISWSILVALLCVAIGILLVNHKPKPTPTQTP